MNGADRLCDVLLANGVDVCFANPGTSEMHFVAALDRKPAMRCVLGLFEGVVTGAADGFGRMADRPAATLLHTGPGLANGLANLHNARRAQTPVVNVVGDHASYHLRFDAPLTSDIDSLARPMSQWVRRVAGPEDVGPAAAAACVAARTIPGVATLILPADAAWGEVAPAPVEPASGLVRPVATAGATRAAAEAIRRAPGRVGLVLAGPALRGDALATAGRIAAACRARLFCAPLVARVERGRGRVPVARIPYPLDAATATLRDMDALILVGAPEPVAFFAYPGKPSRLVHDGCAVITLATPDCDLGRTLEALAVELGVSRFQPSLAPPPDGTNGVPQGSLTGDAVAIILARMLPEGAIVCDEALTSARELFAFGAHAAPHDYLMNTGGAIGIGIPLSVGAAVACPQRKVVTLQADGSGMYTVQGLWTQARERLDVLTVVFSNRAYAILRMELRNLGVNQVGRNAERMMSLDQPALDWVSLAKGMGVDGARATTCEGFASLLASALQRRDPFLIEAVI